MKLAVLFAVMVGVQQGDDLEPLWKFKKGTTWTYEQTEGTKKAKVTRKVINESAAPAMLFVESKTVAKDEKISPKTETIVWAADAGLKLCEKKGDTITMKYLVIPSNSGEAWTYSDAQGKKIQGTRLKTGEVKVPAGTYEETVHTRLEMPDGETVDFYLAPEVGLIKMVREKDSETSTLELTEFKEPK
ncbi:MAG: hypothetical protein HYY16_06670 [Planctomycetes bacterium]|nr:hypothetical protein [Planctomycetota bacterium]